MIADPGSSPYRASLVIPARNAAPTLERCLTGACSILASDSHLIEIVLVDDASTDETASIAQHFPVRVLAGTGRGAGAARNLGWRAAEAPLIWFLDADCVPAQDALTLLLRRLVANDLVGVGGSYFNLHPESTLATVIDEEIAVRHRAMSEPVSFIGTFNALYRRAALDAIGGFDEQLLRAQDAELSMRLVAKGARLGFQRESRVGHFHETRLGAYLRVQARNAYWGAFVYRRHSLARSGDGYNRLADHVQPPLALLVSGASFALPRPSALLVTAVASTLLALAQVPMSVRLRASRKWSTPLVFAALGFVRAFFRAFGFLVGFASASVQRSPHPATSGQVPPVTSR